MGRKSKLYQGIEGQRRSVCVIAIDGDPAAQNLPLRESSAYGCAAVRGNIAVYAARLHVAGVERCRTDSARFSFMLNLYLCNRKANTVFFLLLKLIAPINAIVARFIPNPVVKGYVSLSCLVWRFLLVVFSVEAAPAARWRALAGEQ